MADLRIIPSDGDDEVVQLIRDDDGLEANSARIVSLLSKENVNRQAIGIPLLLFYLKTTRRLDIGVLKAFVSHGCNLNVQDEHGQSALHWLVGFKLVSLRDGCGQTMEQVVSLVDLFLSNGANPSLFDDDGNNVLMVAMNSQYKDWHKLIKPLIVDPRYNRQLLYGTNKSGENVLSLCVRLNCLDAVFFELRSIAQELDTVTTDDNGSNYLHSLYLKPPDKNQPTMDFTECIDDDAQYDQDALTPDTQPGYLFSCYLEYLVEDGEYLLESGANVSKKNNDGLVPLQVALLNLGRKRMYQIRELELLIPPSEVLSEQVPWSTSITGLILTNYCDELIPLLVRLVGSGLNCSHEQVMTTVLSFDSYEFQLFRILVGGGANATITDIIEVLKRIDYLNKDLVPQQKDINKYILCLLLEHCLPNDLVTILNGSIPGLVTYLIRCTGNHMDFLLGKLLQKELVLEIEDFRTALSHRPTICYVFLQYISPELIAELNLERPSVFERIISFGQDGNDWLFGIFVDAGIHITADSLLKVFNSDCEFSYLYNLVKLMTEEVKDQLKELLPNVISHLIKAVKRNQQNIANLLDLLIALDFKVTIDDMLELFDRRLAFSTLLLSVNATGDQDKDKMSRMIPDAIGKVIENDMRFGYNWIESCAELIETLVKLGIKIKINDLKRAQLTYRDTARFPMQCLIKHLDISLKDEIKRELPYLVVQVLEGWASNESNGDTSLIVDTIIVLLDEFQFDVKHSDATQGSFLHFLIGLSAKLPFCQQELLLILDNVLTLNELDLDKATVVSDVPGNMSALIGNGPVVRPIDLALQLKQFKIVDKLIVAGANCDGLNLTGLKHDRARSMNTARLLYISGHYVEIDGNERLKEWIEMLPVRSLQELAALAVRRSLSRTELNDIVDELVFPQNVLDYFKLAHVQLEVEPEDTETSNCYSDSSFHANIIYSTSSSEYDSD